MDSLTDLEILDLILSKLNMDKGVWYEKEELTMGIQLDAGEIIMNSTTLLNFLQKHEMISIHPDKSNPEKTKYWCSILPKGSMHIENGGYVRQDKDKAEIDRLNTEKLKVNLAHAQRIFKSYPATQIMAIVACAVSVVLLFLEIARALKIWPYNR